ncbi:MAG TPA: DoxX family protein [Gammaproteobacteria bacterium]|nr:DoxX family protein [Gammaproteobacteria bacterium]
MNAIDRSDIFGKRSFLRAALWLAQALIAGVYLSTGIAALVLPAAQISAIVPWATHLPGAVLIFLCAAELSAGAGVLLPSVTRIAPALSVTAAVCSAALQAIAIFFHALLGMPQMLPVGVIVFALSVFVAWGRSDREPIASRWQDRRMAPLDAFAGGRVHASEGRIERRRRATRRQRKSDRASFTIRRGLRATPFRRANKGKPARRDRPSSIRD